MKNKLLVILFCLAIWSCKEDDETSSAPVDDKFNTNIATLVKQGTLEGIGHTASGIASIYTIDGMATVVLDPYSSQSGPDLKVYLSKDESASEYLRLGNLKSTMGKQSYEIPAGTELRDYHYIHVWCEKYTVVFARASLN